MRPRRRCLVLRAFDADILSHGLFPGTVAIVGVEAGVQALVASQVDGLLICHSPETENFDLVKPSACRGIPVVHFDRVNNEADIAKVILDDWNGAFNVTEHLIQRGARCPECEVPIKLQTEEAEAALAAWLALPEPPDAIFAINYSNAFDLPVALKKRSLRVPRDIALSQQAARLFLEQVQQKENFQPRTFVISGN